MIFNRINKRREISFSESFQNYVGNSLEKSQYSSPSIAYESKILSFSRQKKREQSPIHNLHFKYLPNSYKLSQLEESSLQEAIKERNQNNYEKADMMEEINKKIRTILSSISEEEQRKDYYFQKYSINIPEDSHHQPFNLHERRIRYTSKESLTKRYQTPLKNKGFEENKKSLNNPYSNLSSIQSEHKYRTPLGQLNQSSFQNRKNTEQNLKKGKVSIDFLLKKDENKRELIIRGKNITNEIEKIQAKMETLSQLKRNMNIEHSSESSLIKETSNSLQNTRISNLPSKIPSQKITTRSPTEIKEEEVQKKANIEVFKSQFFQEEPKIDNSQEVEIPKILKKATEKKKKKKVELNIIEASISQFNLVNQFEIKGVSNNDLKDEKRMQNSRETNSSERKIIKGVIKKQSNFLKTEVSSNPTQNSELSRLMRNFACQIKLDEYFRKVKQWFHRLKLPSKWQELEACLLPKDKHKNSSKNSQFDSYFSLTDQEQNPFYTPRNSDFSLNELVQAYNQCLSHWELNIQNQYDLRELMKGGFTEDNIDLRKRGFIRMEDLSRFFNCQLDTYYRNRDIYLIYERLKEGDELHFGDIAKKLQKK